MRSAFSLVNIVATTILLSFNGAPANSLRDDVLKYTNEFRKSHKRSALEMRADMNAIAQKHSQDMASGRTGFGHDGFSQRMAQVKKKMKNCGNFGENVAFGLSTGKAAVELWETSEQHRKNLLGDFKYIGIGVAKDKRGQTYFTQIFAQ